MPAVPSQMLELGTALPEFSLVDVVTGHTVSSPALVGAPLVVAFICNHCPYVKHIAPEFALFGQECRERGVKVVAISSNDAAAYPDDSPDKMRVEAAQRGYPFPYLHDDDQEVARAFRAACTPEFYLFDAEAKLVYRGQFDDSRPSNGKPVTGRDLRAALSALLEGRLPVLDQTPSMGCSIKWKPEARPPWAP